MTSTEWHLFGSVSGDKPDAVVHFTNKVDGSYEIHAAPVSPWVFTDNFEWSGPNGWYSKGEGKYEIACEKLDFLTYTAFVDASLCFGARMNGQMYIPSNEAGNTIPWSVSSAYQPSPQPYIDPAEALIAVGETKSFRYGYDNIFYTNPGGLWKYSGTDVDGNSVQIDWQNAGANYGLPTTLKAGQYMLTAARNTQGAFSAYASAKIIQVKSVSAGEVTSTVDSSATSIPTLYVERKDNTTITVTATPEPGSDWPANYPTWSGGGTVDSNDPAKYIIPGNVATSYTVTATCGNEKAIKVVVVDVIIKEGTTVVSDGTSRDKIVGQKVSLTAEILPSDLTVTSKEWTIPGTRIKNYTTTFTAETTSAVKTPLDDEDLNNTSISYYWVDGADARNVKFSISIDIGNNKTFEKETTAIYNVKRPNSTLTTQTGSIFIGTVAGRNVLAFSGENGGVSFNASIVLSSGISGTGQYWQKVNTTVISTLGGNYLPIAGTDLLDTSLPYGNLPSVSDNPHAILPNDATTVVVGSTYTMWLMFKPSGGDSIWIPLRSVDWRWSGTAKQQDGMWTITKSDHSESPESVETTKFPIWNGNVKDLLN